MMNIINKFFGVKINAMRENPVAIQVKIDYLNSLVPGQIWFAISGFSAITSVSYDSSGGLIFNPSQGYIVKVFVNSATGEVRSYAAQLFQITDAT
jgi:hypothetical protein